MKDMEQIQTEMTNKEILANIDVSAEELRSYEYAGEKVIVYRTHTCITGDNFRVITELGFTVRHISAHRGKMKYSKKFVDYIDVEIAKRVN